MERCSDHWLCPTCGDDFMQTVYRNIQAESNRHNVRPSSRREDFNHFMCPCCEIQSTSHPEPKRANTPLNSYHCGSCSPSRSHNERSYNRMPANHNFGFQPGDFQRNGVKFNVPGRGEVGCTCNRRPPPSQNDYCTCPPTRSRQQKLENDWAIVESIPARKPPAPLVSVSWPECSNTSSHRPPSQQGPNHNSKYCAVLVPKEWLPPCVKPYDQVVLGAPPK